MRAALRSAMQKGLLYLWHNCNSSRINPPLPILTHGLVLYSVAYVQAVVCHEGCVQWGHEYICKLQRQLSRDKNACQLHIVNSPGQSLYFCLQPHLLLSSPLPHLPFLFFSTPLSLSPRNSRCLRSPSPSLLSVLQPTLLRALMVHAIRKPIFGREEGRVVSISAKRLL